MDAGAIGSGRSWVGYHLTAYLALHRYFISSGRKSRLVPPKGGRRPQQQPRCAGPF
ncbi:DUF3732 domain-containing protein [Arthrobacter sp. SAFR-044]|uniref:DUF3732 domain-containing protein n=1 Tax=Arthrobacter sp. SAFR-044 TaxID=3387278 RepID=UPI003F7C2369